MQHFKNEALKPAPLHTQRQFHPVKRWLTPLLINYGKRLGFAKQAVEFARKSQEVFSPGRKRLQQVFSQYQPTRHDVFVTTSPKSGTNWLLQIAQQIAYLGDSEFEHIHDVVAWPNGPGQLTVSLSDPTPQKLSPTGLRVIKTHLEPNFIPYHEQAKYLSVVRDPKEVFVSTYYFGCERLGVIDHISIDDWYQISVNMMVKRWASHTASIWNWRDHPNTLILNYREMKKNPRLAIEQVAATMGVELTEPQLTKVLKRSSFEYMKAHQSQFSPRGKNSVRQTKSTLMIRRGQSGEAKKYLNQSQLAEIDLACQTELQRLGSDFPYESAFNCS